VTLEEEYDVLRGVVDLLAAGRVGLVGGSSGCAVASLFAARHPDVTESLVLYGGYVRGTDIASPAARSAMIAAVQTHWGLGSRVLADVFLPGASAVERGGFADFQRRTMTPDQAAAGLRAAYSFDSSAHLGAIRAATIVLHRRGDRAIPFPLGQELASRIMRARFVALEGDDHFPWRGDRDSVADEIVRFWGGRVPARPAIAGRQELTEREREVLAMVSHGLTDAEIADRLVLSVHTVHRHVANIRTKLRVPSRAAAAAWASSHRLF
jgi:DNA-binding CsgD family transcriptional regulator/pimeloyl-ACP methyl ester carboxylesterase